MSRTVDPITQRRRRVGWIARNRARDFGGYTMIAPQAALSE
jgi:hypothetical protein